MLEGYYAWPASTFMPSLTNGGMLVRTYRSLLLTAVLTAAVSWIVVTFASSAETRHITFAIPAKSTLPNKPDKPIAAFSLLSDIHVQKNDKLSQKLFVKALKYHYSTKPDADMLLLNGDLTNGGKDDFDKLRELLDSNRHAPVYATMGNHEYYGIWRHGGIYHYSKLGKGWSSAKAIAQFTDFFGYSKLYREVSVHGVPFLFMSGEAYRDVNPSIAEDAFLSDEQLDWLETRLAEHRDRRTAKSGSAGGTDLPALVFLHQPLPDTLDGSSIERGVVQHERLRSILDNYPFAVLFSGHTHWDWETTDQVWSGPFTAVGSASVRNVYGPDNKPVVPVKSESLFVEVYSGRLVIRAIDHEDDSWIGDPAVIEWNG
jgi:3',5'-cyclic AMP phosphodiesterase CpdA